MSVLMPRLPSGSERVRSGEIDARKVIESLVPLERRRDAGDRTSCSCPNPDHEDRNPSFSVNLSTGNWTCFSRCGSGNLGSLLVLAGRARSAAEGWKLAEGFASNGRSPDSQKRSSHPSRPKWTESKIKQGRETGPEADDLLEGFAGMVRLPAACLTKWDVTICKRRNWDGGYDTVMVARVPVSQPDGAITGGWDRVLACETNPELVGKKRSIWGGSGGGDGSGIWLDRLSRYHDQRPDWLLLTAGVSDGLDMSALVVDGPGASSVCVVSATAAGMVPRVVESVLKFWKPSEGLPRLGLMLDTDEVDKKAAAQAAALWPGGAVSLRRLLPKGCKDVRAAAAVWDAYYRPLGQQWTVEVGAVLGKMLNSDVSDRTQNGSG